MDVFRGALRRGLGARVLAACPWTPEYGCLGRVTQNLPLLGTRRVTLTLILAGHAPLDPTRSSRLPMALPVPASCLLPPPGNGQHQQQTASESIPATATSSQIS